MKILKRIITLFLVITIYINGFIFIPPTKVSAEPVTLSVLAISAVASLMVAGGLAFTEAQTGAVTKTATAIYNSSSGALKQWADDTALNMQTSGLLINYGVQVAQGAWGELSTWFNSQTVSSGNIEIDKPSYPYSYFGFPVVSQSANISQMINVFNLGISNTVNGVTYSVSKNVVADIINYTVTIYKNGSLIQTYNNHIHNINQPSECVFLLPVGNDLMLYFQAYGDSILGDGSIGTMLYNFVNVSLTPAVSQSVPYTPNQTFAPANDSICVPQTVGQSSGKTATDVVNTGGLTVPSGSVTWEGSLSDNPRGLEFGVPVPSLPGISTGTWTGTFSNTGTFTGTLTQDGVRTWEGTIPTTATNTSVITAINSLVGSLVVDFVTPFGNFKNSIDTKFMPFYNNFKNTINSMSYNPFVFEDLKAVLYGEERVVVKLSMINQYLPTFRLWFSYIFWIFYAFYVYDQLYFLIRGTHSLNMSINSSQIAYNAREEKLNYTTGGWHY